MRKVIQEFMEVGHVYMELITKTEKTKRNYNGIELYPSEIHTLVFIHDHHALNMTAMAQKLGVTKGAINKLINKLEDKGLLTRYKQTHNSKNTYFKLTEKGLIAYDGHERFHRDFFGEPSEGFSSFVAEHEDVILKMLHLTKEYLKEHIEKIEE